MAVVRLPFFGNYNTRAASTSKDQRFKNCYIEVIEQVLLQSEQKQANARYYVVKRPGMSQHTSVTAGVGRGIYSWKGNIYSVIGNKLYKGSSQIGSNLTNSTGKVWFTEEHVTDLLVIKDNDKIITVTTSDTVTELSDADIPTSLVAGVVYLDTYILVMDTNGVIYNSNVDDVTSWTSGDFLTATVEPDDGVAIAKHRNYALAFGAWTTEVFYDAANPSGSPLDPVEGTVHHIGCAAGDTIWADEDTVLWLARTRDGGVQFVAMDGLKISSLSTPTIERIFDQEEANITSASGFGFRIAGHLFYILRLNTSTWVCDVGNKAWYEWTVYNGSSEEAFTGIGHCQAGGKNYILDEDNGKVYEMDIDKYQDDSQEIRFEVVTPVLDFNTSQNKFMNRVTLIGDVDTTASAISLSYTDDDYQNYSTAVSLDANKRNPSAYAQGRFQRRAYKVAHTANRPLRLEGLEFDLEVGDNEGGNQ
jgi:hypothetical protein